MREFYLAPYKKLIERDRLPSIMTAYNAVRGVRVGQPLFCRHCCTQDIRT
jgi:hypothetical protein